MAGWVLAFAQVFCGVGRWMAGGVLGGAARPLGVWVANKSD